MYFFFLICDAFALFILNLLTSTYSSRQCAPPLSSYKLFKFLIIPPLGKVDMRMLQQNKCPVLKKSENFLMLTDLFHI